MNAILIAGVGALGSHAALLLSDLKLVLQDFDIVQEDNLSRTAIYTRDDIGKPKAEAAAARIGAEARLEPFTFETPLDGIALIVDGTDSLEARFVLNDAAKRAGIPVVIGTAAGDRGMAFTAAPEGPCWRCIALGKTPVDDCTTGIERSTIEAVVGVQARMARAALAGSPEEGLVIVGTRERRITVARNPRCDTCNGVFRDAPFTIAFCKGVGRIRARPNMPRALDLAAVPGERVATYGTAVRVRLGAGAALVHLHGLIEFEGVPEAEARKFAALLSERAVSRNA